MQAPERLDRHVVLPQLAGRGHVIRPRAPVKHAMQGMWAILDEDPKRCPAQDVATTPAEASFLLKCWVVFAIQIPAAPWTTIDHEVVRVAMLQDLLNSVSV